MDDEQIEAAQYQAYQILPMPVDTNRAGFVRHTGLAAGARRLPRALLPLPADHDRIPLANLHDVDHPQALAPAGADVAQVWVDLAIPATAKPGSYTGAIDLQAGGQIIASIPVQLTVWDFVIPDERHLAMVGRLNWDRLVEHYETTFGTLTDFLISRKDPKYADAVRVLDQIVSLGQQHRAQIIVPNLQPQVKWPAGKPPQVDWGDFDSVVMPWLKGDAFADKVPIGYWPLPAAQYVFNFNAQARSQYWAAAASHFDQLNLLSHAPLLLEADAGGPPNPAQAIALSQEADRLMAVHQNIVICLPLEDDQLTFQGPNNAGIDPATTKKQLLTIAPGIVFASPSNPWPKNVDHPPHLLAHRPAWVDPVRRRGGRRPGRAAVGVARLPPHGGRGAVGQRAARLQEPRPAGRPQRSRLVLSRKLVRGRRTGADGPAQMDSPRRLRLRIPPAGQAARRSDQGAGDGPLPDQACATERQAPDPTYALMTGTTNAAAWETGRELLARLIIARVPGQHVDEELQNTLTQLTGEILQWTTALEWPLLLGRSTSWGWGVNHQQGNWSDLKFGLDIYNAAGVRLIGDLRWAAVPPGSAWEVAPQPVQIPPNQSIDTFNVRRYTMDASVNLDRINPQTRQPIDLVFSNELGGKNIVLRVVCPAATSEKLEGAGRFKLDGNLNEWLEADSLHDGKLVQMLSRASLQRQELKWASTPSQVFSGWAAQNFYVAFKVEGVSNTNAGGRSFIDYQFRRAWGEDLVQILVQPIYINNDVGPVLHVTCKPHGQVDVESKVNAQLNANPWQAIVGANVRYADTQEGDIWRGELSIPWNAINDAKHQGVQPTLLRFNFVQHQNATGESSSWAGPLDYGRDDAFMGLLFLRQGGANGGGRGRDYGSR